MQKLIHNAIIWGRINGNKAKDTTKSKAKETKETILNAWHTNLETGKVERRTKTKTEGPNLYK